MTRRPTNAHALTMQAARAAAIIDDEEAAPAPAVALEAPPHAPRGDVAAAQAPKGRGRPPGKRSDPEFKPTTLFLRTRTKRAAIRLLEDLGDERDLSELVEELLEGWTRRDR